MCPTVAFILRFVQMPERFNSSNVSPTPRFDKTGRKVNSLMSVIHSYPKPNKSMTRGSTYLRKNNFISSYPKMLGGAFLDHNNKSVVNDSMGL